MQNINYGSILSDVLRWKFPGKELCCGEDTDSINFVNKDVNLDISTIPQLIAEYEIYSKTIDYQAPRRREYENIIDWFDQIWHDIDNGTLDKNGIFYTNRLAIKTKYPKTL